MFCVISEMKSKHCQLIQSFNRFIKQIKLLFQGETLAASPRLDQLLPTRICVPMRLWFIILHRLYLGLFSCALDNLQCNLLIHFKCMSHRGEGLFGYQEHNLCVFILVLGFYENGINGRPSFAMFFRRTQSIQCVYGIMEVAQLMEMVEWPLFHALTGWPLLSAPAVWVAMVQTIPEDKFLKCYTTGLFYRVKLSLYAFLYAFLKKGKWRDLLDSWSLSVP